MKVKILSLPENFMEILQKLRSVFTEPSYFYFTEYIKGILLSSRKRVTAFYMLGDRIKHFTDYHRFLYQYQWDPVDLGLTLLKVLISLLHIQELRFALDDSLVAKYGKKIWGRGTHFDHAAKENLAQYIKGHNWVVIGLLYHVSVLKKWLCFPFFAKLFIPRKAVRSSESFQTKIELSISMLKEIQSNVCLPLILVADALYAKKKLIRHCMSSGISMISRLRSDAALYIPLTQMKGSKKRGRPRIKGKRFPSLEKMSKHKKHFLSLTLPLYGKETTVSYREFLAYWNPAGGIIKVLIVDYPQKRGTVTAYFFSTDIRQSAASILTHIAARWSLENAFKDMKQHLGFGAWQCFSKKSVLRSVPMSCVAYSTLLLWSQKQIMHCAPRLWDAMPWNSGKETVSVNDMLYQLKYECITNGINNILPKDRYSKQKIKQVQQILKLAA